MKILIMLVVLVSSSLYAQQKHFTVAADPDYAPFTFKGIDGKPEGLFIDLWNLWAKVNNYTVSYRFYDWEDTLEATRTGEVDFHSGTSKDYNWMEVSVPIYRIKTSLYTPVNSKIKSANDLQGKTIGTIDEYYGEMVQKLCQGECRVKQYETYKQLITAARQKEIDAFVDDTDALTYYFIKNSLMTEFVKVPEIVLHKDDLVYAVTNHEKRYLLPIINNGLKHIKAEQLLFLENKWLPNVSDAYYHSTLKDASQEDTNSMWLWYLVAFLLGGLGLYNYKLYASHKKIHEDTLRDELTGVYNKRAFNTFYKLDADYLGLVFVDVDFFKLLNDTYGHSAGDAFLQKLGGLFCSLSDDSTLFYRVGGDEFVAVVTDKSETGIKNLCETIRTEVEAMQFPNTQSPWGHVTVTLGASSAKSPIDKTKLYNMADKALLLAKSEGKNRCLYLPYETYTGL